MKLTERTKERINNYFNGVSAKQLYDLTIKYGIVEAGGEQELVKKLTIPDVVKSFSAEQVVNELKDCETLDDAIMYFSEIK